MNPILSNKALLIVASTLVGAIRSLSTVMKRLLRYKMFSIICFLFRIVKFNYILYLHLLLTLKKAIK